jgi:hypothetical protein
MMHSHLCLKYWRRLTFRLSQRRESISRLGTDPHGQVRVLARSLSLSLALTLDPFRSLWDLRNIYEQARLVKVSQDDWCVKANDGDTSLGKYPESPLRLEALVSDIYTDSR